MKKTLTVNLGGTVFHIDEDAYQLLDKYLSNLRIHFRREEGSEEIMDDFEMRISELLGERIRLGYGVITIDQIDEVIKRMGKPEEIFEDEGKENGQKETSAASGLNGNEETKRTVKRRLMRDPDNRVLGGVAGGFAAYMDWDPTVVRIVLFLLIFLYGVTVPIYFLLWIIVPMARTATEKLQMRGESVTIENIGKTVTDSFENAHVNEHAAVDKSRTSLQKIGDSVVDVLGVLLKVLLVLVGIVLVPPLLVALFVLLVVVIAVVFGGGAKLLHGIFPMDAWNTLSNYPEATVVIGTICVILIVGIPILLLIYAVGNRFFKLKPLSSNVKWVLGILFLLAFSFFANILFTASKYGVSLWDGWGGQGWNSAWWHGHGCWQSVDWLKYIGQELSRWLY